jgi:hypothetical protein
MADLVDHWHHDKGSGAQPAASFNVHSRIGLAVLTVLPLTGLEGKARESGTRIDPRSEFWSAGSRGCAANHLISVAQGERRSIGRSGLTDVLGNLVQDQVERYFG